MKPLRVLCSRCDAVSDEVALVMEGMPDNQRTIVWATWIAASERKMFSHTLRSEHWTRVFKAPSGRGDAILCNTCDAEWKRAENEHKRRGAEDFQSTWKTFMREDDT